MLLENKNVLITGAGKGIGESCVSNCIQNGGYVFALIKSNKDNKKFSKNKKIKIYNGDVRNKKLILKIFDDSKKIKRPINCIINNAGLRFRKKFLKINEKELKEIFDVNYLSIFHILQIFSKFVIKKKIKGSIVNISSIVGKLGFKELSGYAASKGALTALTKSYAVEMSEYGIRANTISPGFIKTSFYEKFKKDKKKLYKWTLSRVPQKRWGNPSEIAELASFLLSNKSNYINGEDISIDGGWTNA
jgi:NAD(P)-dependent dehydrogenase (short-subunit alcohol dehydrogenase family)|tara:strand:+ start:145 stop:885 length:741 start_codon:yes stop_codon:yes gene_type:complete